MGKPVVLGKVEARCTDCSCGERPKEDGPGRVREDRARGAAPGDQQESKPGHGGVLGRLGSWARGTEADPGWGSSRAALRRLELLENVPRPSCPGFLGAWPWWEGSWCSRLPGPSQNGVRMVLLRPTHGFHWSHGAAWKPARGHQWTRVESRSGLPWPLLQPWGCPVGTGPLGGGGEDRATAGLETGASVSQ